MDNICHTLVGAAIGESGLKSRTRLATATLLIAANLPDIDVLVFATHTPAVSFRRGWTHGILAQLLLPPLLTAVVIAWAYVRDHRGQAPDRRDPDADTHLSTPPLRAGWILGLAYIGIFSHVLLDWLNNYGVRLLAPFDWRWFYGDALFIVDPWLWLTLGAGVWLSRRRRATVPARGALLFASCYIAIMVLSTQAARGIVSGAWRSARQTDPRRVMTGPVPVTPFRRAVIVDAGDRYETGTFTWWDGSVRFDPRPVPKNDHLPAVILARTDPDPAVRGFLVWARFPYWTITREDDYRRVTVGDMRFVDSPAHFEASGKVAK